jgi:hypothetical protein
MEFLTTHVVLACLAEIHWPKEKKIVESCYAIFELKLACSDQLQNFSICSQAR